MSRIRIFIVSDIECDFYASLEFFKRLLLSNSQGRPIGTNVQFEKWDASADGVQTYSTPSIFFLVFDVTKPESFNNLLAVSNDINQKVGGEKQFVLLGDRTNLQRHHEPAVTEAEITRFKQRLNVSVSFLVTKPKSVLLEDLINKLERYTRRIGSYNGNHGTLFSLFNSAENRKKNCEIAKVFLTSLETLRSEAVTNIAPIHDIFSQITRTRGCLFTTFSSNGHSIRSKEFQGIITHALKSAL